MQTHTHIRTCLIVCMKRNTPCTLRREAIRNRLYGKEQALYENLRHTEGRQQMDSAVDIEAGRISNSGFGKIAKPFCKYKKFSKFNLSNPLQCSTEWSDLGI